MLHRRHLIAGLAATLALPRAARAEIVCQPWSPGVEACEAGLKFAPDVRTAPQECPYWCWAACIQTAFAVAGHDVHQQTIVQRVFGNPVCSVADGPTITRAATGAWTSNSGRNFAAAATVIIDSQYGMYRPDAHLVAAAELEAGRPLILGALGHAVLLTAMQFSRDSYGNTQVHSLTIRDPWPTNPNRRVLSGMEVQQISFLATVQVA